MDRNELKNMIINENLITVTHDEIKKNIAYNIVYELQKEIENKNNFRDKKEFETACKNEFLNAGVFNYYKEKENILYFENTPENRKKYFSLDNILNLINEGVNLYNYNTWFIKYDNNKKMVLDITTADSIAQIEFNKNFQLWLLENYKYYNNYDIAEISKNIDCIIDDAITELKNSYIETTCIFNDDTTQKVYFKKFYNYFYDFQAMDENNDPVNIAQIKEINNKSIPVLKNALNFNIENISLYNELEKDFEINKKDWFGGCLSFNLKNTYTTIMLYKNHVSLSYRNINKFFYIINNNFYEFNYYKKDCIKQIDPFKDIASEKTKNLLKIAINKIMEEGF